MGVSSSRTEDDKALLLCRERKRFVKQALDGRCSLAAAHVAYMQSLRNTGTALWKFVEPEIHTESSLYTSTTATPEPLALTDKSLSQFSYSPPSMSQHVETSEPFSPTPSPPLSSRLQVNYMKTGGSTSTKVEERLPFSVTATLEPPLKSTHQNSVSQPTERPETPPPPGTPPWDYFDLFIPIDSRFSFQDGRALNHGLDNSDDIRRLREEEGIPELEEEGEKVAFIGRAGYSDSEEEFDDPSTDPVAQIPGISKEVADSHSTNASPTLPFAGSTSKETRRLNGEQRRLMNGMYEVDETPTMTPSQTTPSVATVALDEKRAEKASGSECKLVAKDFVSSIKEIEYYFLKASESSKHVLRMLEANTVSYHQLFPENKARRSMASILITSCFACCEDATHVPQEPAQNAVKYLTWHRSASSHSSSSRNPLGSATKDNIEDSSSILFSSFGMNSGSHASTLDRLYAWERKLYDEVKASGFIRKEYDMQCKILRQKDSRAEKANRIDRTRSIVKDLHSRIRVAIHRIDSISKKIEDLRDQELQPQLEELMEGLSRMWEMMYESHKLQYNIISIAYINGTSKVCIRSESHRQATINLECELTSLCSTFTKWINAHKSYLESINKWLLKCVFPLRQKSSRRRTVEFCPRRDVAPPIFITCRDWISGLEKLPTKEVADSIKELAAETTRFLPRQERNQSKEKVNEVMEELNLSFDGLHSRLVGFLDRLRDFSESSVKMYGDLGEAIKDAQAIYDQRAPSTQV
eukprot:TRINITY_DN9834_c0_g1_i1.p1 TRINITY_DN9834_c0_g1~~TRINITY_DN9834_c0_g1_i1.p1  ORF type:complete len:755 (+),score=139.89 TRINITY_DN9834_c0_g1_i1:225-2489(+)